MHADNPKELLIRDLKEQIERAEVVAIVGAGVTIGATNNKPCASWIGLLKNGVDRCGAVANDLPPGWKERILNQIDNGDTLELVLAAENVADRLGASDGGGEYRRWLRETVGSLKCYYPEVIEELHRLGIKLATTNYDGLIEEVTRLRPVTWMDGSDVERVIKGDDTGVLHLHGYWQNPSSVILGIRSYEKVMTSAHAQNVLKALTTMKTLLFVGFGAGLKDPNFGSLLKWTSTIFSQSEYRRFQLATNGAASKIRHPEQQRFFVLGYGENYSDLAPFLRNRLAGIQPDKPSSNRRDKSTDPPNTQSGRTSLSSAKRNIQPLREQLELVCKFFVKFRLLQEAEILLTEYRIRFQRNRFFEEASRDVANAKNNASEDRAVYAGIAIGVVIFCIITGLAASLAMNAGNALLAWHGVDSHEGNARGLIAKTPYAFLILALFGVCVFSKSLESETRGNPWRLFFRLLYGGIGALAIASFTGILLKGVTGIPTLLVILYQWILIVFGLSTLYLTMNGAAYSKRFSRIPVLIVSVIICLVGFGLTKTLSRDGLTMLVVIAAIATIVFTISNLFDSRSRKNAVTIEAAVEAFIVQLAREIVHHVTGRLPEAEQPEKEHDALNLQNVKLDEAEELIEAVLAYSHHQKSVDLFDRIHRLRERLNKRS